MKCNINIQEIIRIAREAGKIAMFFYRKKYAIKDKKDRTPVTEADIAINDYLMEELSKYNYPIISEEIKDNFEKRKNAEFTWIIDPLDGTSDFIQKTGEFSIMIGLINKKGESVLGVVYVPALSELYYAQRGEGSYICHSKFQDELSSIGEWDSLDCNSEFQQKIQVNKNPTKNGKILTSRNHLGKYEQEIAKKYNMTQTPVGSAGLKICWIARGNAELYINSSNKSGLWDICAADIILTEAGGKICDNNNNKILYNAKNVMLQNGYIVATTILDIV